MRLKVDIDHFLALRFQFIFSKILKSLVNCVEIANLARFFSLNEVEDAVKNFILKNFSQFVQTEEYLKLSVDDVCAILSADSIRGQSELELFKAGDKWLKHDPARMQHVLSVMRFSFTYKNNSHFISLAIYGFLL